MAVEEWLQQYGNPIEASALKIKTAAAFLRFVERYGRSLATVVAVYQGKDRELVVLDFRTGRPQNSFYPIRKTERIAINFTKTDSLPFVYMLRDDFPDTDHQQLAIEGAPRAICVDNRSWPEARLTWTPAELVQRILSWFERAAKGQLHDARQPVDPVLFGSSLSFLISRNALENAGDLDLIGVHDKEYKRMLRVKRVQDVQEPLDQLEPICIIAYQIPPEKMRRMTFAPGNLDSLSTMLGERGIELYSDLAEKSSAWIKEENGLRLHSRLAVIVETPVIAPNGEQRNGTDLRAYIINETVGNIAVALGVAHKSESRELGSEIGYVSALGKPEPQTDAIKEIEALAAEVHLEFDQKLAAQITGRGEPDTRKAVMIGAGAIGSHLADCLVREGRFQWTFIDHDRVLPHNLARHTARGWNVTKNKADTAAIAAKQIITADDFIPQAIPYEFGSNEAIEDIEASLGAADIIIDATASVLAARKLSDHSASSRRISVFFNPAGSDGVLLAEPTDRTISLRDLEAQYWGAVARRDGLKDHLKEPDGDFAYTGACRAITNMIPASNVMALTGLVSKGVSRIVDSDDGAIKIWSMEETGAVSVEELPPEPTYRYLADEWFISIDQGLIDRIYEMRSAKLPNETGGVLLGVVDIPHKSIHIVDGLSAPVDSKESQAGFVRGSAGVIEALDNAHQRTMGQLRYIGEWHSHPPRSGSMPSATDLTQLDWLSSLFDMDSMPALMVIAGDDSLSIILANVEAEPLSDEADNEKQAAGDAA